MTYGLPHDPDAPAPHPGPALPGPDAAPGLPDAAPAQPPKSPSPGVGYSAPALPGPGYPAPHQSWEPDGQPPLAPAKSAGPAVVALVLGILGCVVPLLPVNLDQVRAYVPFPFAVAGLAFAIVGVLGRRRGKPLAVAGAVLAVIALALGTIMVGGNVIDQSTETGAAQVRDSSPISEPAPATIRATAQARTG